MKQFFFAIVMSSLAMFSSAQQDLNSAKVKDVLDLVSGQYVDSLSGGEMTNEIITNFLKTLDPHSSYLKPEEVTESKEKLNGSFKGIGVQYAIFRDSLFIVYVYPDGPADQAGMQYGDRIIAVNGRALPNHKDSLTVPFISKLLKGEEGSEVQLQVMRRGETSIDMVINRGEISVNTVVSAFMVDQNIGYIRVSRFASRTAEEFSLALQSLKAKGMNQLVLDLRGNGGGYLHVAVRMADEFLTEDKLIVYTQGTNSPRRKYVSSDRGIFKEGDVAVLIDERSASASEILAGALQDHDRAIVVGRRSFGKGLVQKAFTMRDGSMVRLTVARYYTPSGRCIQRSYQDAVAYDDDRQNRLDRGELYYADSIEVDSSLAYETTGGRVVFGGGGIIPDKFVGLDTSGITDVYTLLKKDRILHDQVIAYADLYGEEVKMEFSNYKKFDNGFDVSDMLNRNFFEQAAAHDIYVYDVFQERNWELISVYLKSVLAKQLWGPEAYDFVRQQESCTYLTAIDLLRFDVVVVENRINE